MIVANRLADDGLWVEALNLGVFDLLAKPFDSREMLRTVPTACRRQDTRSRLVRRRKQPEARHSKETARAMGASL